MVLGLGNSNGLGTAVAIVAGLLAFVAVVWSAIGAATFGPRSVFGFFGSVWSALTGAFGTLTGSDALLAGGGIVGLSVAVWRASEADSGEESTLWPLVALASMGAIGFVVLSDPSGAISAATSLWWVPVVAVLGYIGYVFVDERFQGGSGGTATNQTNRRVQGTAEEVSNAGIGMFVAILGTAAAVAMTIMSGLEVFGDLLAMFAGEAAYLVTVALGYLGIGGSLPGGWIVPDLSPAQFVAFALIIAGIAIAFRR
jgi:fructose-1,6-bisphosphatase/inositol monophosphatase family enzyme